LPKGTPRPIRAFYIALACGAAFVLVAALGLNAVPQAKEGLTNTLRALHVMSPPPVNDVGLLSTAWLPSGSTWASASHDYPGKHEPLVTRELWHRVQGVLDGRKESTEKKSKHEFAFSGVIKCGHGGCAMVGDIKKGRYFTTGAATGRIGVRSPTSARKRSQFLDALGRLRFGDGRCNWVKQALEESHADEAKEHKAALARLQADYDRLQTRIEAVYLDKLDGAIDKTTFANLTDGWRQEQSRLLEEIAIRQNADQTYLEVGVQLLDLANNAQDIFRKQAATQKQQMLKFLLSNSTWQNGRLTPAWRQPFDILAETAVLAARETARGRRIGSSYSLAPRSGFEPATSRRLRHHGVTRPRLRTDDRLEDRT
jgi:hypothetical protein